MTKLGTFSQDDMGREVSERRGIPLRTLTDVQACIAQDKPRGVDVAMARLMLRHGRLTAEAREWLAREYPQRD